MTAPRLWHAATGRWVTVAIAINRREWVPA